MHLIFKRGKSVNSSGLTMAWIICYSAVAEMELNKPKKCEWANKESVLLKYPMEMLGSHVIDNQ